MERGRDTEDEDGERLLKGDVINATCREESCHTLTNLEREVDGCYAKRCTPVFVCVHAFVCVCVSLCPCVRFSAVCLPHTQPRVHFHFRQTGAHRVWKHACCCHFVPSTINKLLMSVELPVCSYR